MATKKDIRRLKIKYRIRHKVSGTAEMPRLSVFRSNKEIYAQVIDDVKGVTLAAASSKEKGFEKSGTKSEVAAKVGKTLAERAIAAGINAVVQPGGSVRDQESFDYCEKNGMAMVITGVRHFKH